MTDEGERVRDFSGRVTYGRTFAVFPKHAASDNAVQPQDIGLHLKALGRRPFKHVNIARGTKLRKWWDDMFG